MILDERESEESYWLMKRRKFIELVAAGAVGIAAKPLRLEHKAYKLPSRIPNILIVISDQNRAGLTKRTGYRFDTSPTLDRIAERGVAFDAAYATQPACVPCRTSLLTGRWPHAHRVRQNSTGNQAFFREDIFGVLKTKGYKTGLVGKNHTYLRAEKLDFWREYNDLRGWQPPNAPESIVEFDDWRRRLNFAVSPVATPFPVETQFAYRIVSDAIDFIDEFRDRPFALEVSFPEPHDPEQVPLPYFDMYPPGALPERTVGPEGLEKKGFQWQWMRGLQESIYPGYGDHWRRYVSNYLGSLRMLDDQFARLLQHMEERNLLETTLIVYVADHGDYVMDFGLMRKGVGLPESLVRIPMVWSGAGVRSGQHAITVSIADVMPTLCEAIGADIPIGVQGRSLWPILQGENYPAEEFRSVYAEDGFGGLYYDSRDKVPYSVAEFRGIAPYIVPDEYKTFDELNFVTQSGTAKMVRMGDWKLIYDMMGYGQLYNVATDPEELNNLFNKLGAEAEQASLMAELLMWTIRTQDSLPEGAYKTKWPGDHNWYAPYREGSCPRAFIP
jgi:arylsulfatase A-like enzyme